MIIIFHIYQIHFKNVKLKIVKNVTIMNIVLNVIMNIFWNEKLNECSNISLLDINCRDVPNRFFMIRFLAEPDNFFYRIPNRIPNTSNLFLVTPNFGFPTRIDFFQIIKNEETTNHFILDCQTQH